MLKLKHYLFSFIFSFGLINCFSQQIRGSIKNTKGDVLPYASIYLLNSKIGTTSDENGIFALKITQLLKLDTLVVSYIGYEKYKTPVYLNNTNSKISVILKNTSTNLTEFVVETLPYYPPKEIIKKAIKNIKKNYSRENILSDGFYRELVKEDDKYIALNEAAIQLKYAPYPQKGFIHQAFKAYYDYSTLAWNQIPTSVFYHMSRFTSYIPIDDDQIKIVSSRTSNNNTKYGIESSPVGGPGDLIALDKIKYLYDFLDPKLMDKYHYKQFSEEYFGNEHCYVIDFYPKEIYKNKVFQSLSKKMMYPIYVGRIYISAKTFVVVNFQYQLSNNVDFSIYKNDPRIPDFIKVNVDYKKHNNQWMLNTVTTEQQKNIKIGSKTVTYTCLRSLQLENPKIKKVEFNNDSVAFITKSMQLRYFYNKYDELFWRNYQLSSVYPKLPKKIQTDLEETTPLEKQFLSLNLPIDSIPQPISKKEAFNLIYFSDTINDNYHWLNNKSSDEVVNYLTSENNYYNNVLFKLNDSIKGFYYRYNNIFKHVTDTIKSVNYFTLNNIKCRYKQAESGNIGLYGLLNDSTEKLLLDVSKISKGKPNFWIESTQLNNNAQLAYAYSQKGSITNTLVITHLEYEIPNVYNFLWLNDTTILYTKTDSTQRSFALMAFNLNNKTTQLIYEEKDKTFDVSIKKSTSEQYIFVVVESHNEREFYYLNKGETVITLHPIVKRLQNHNYTIDHKEGSYFYGITNRNKGNYEVVEISIQKPSLENWKTLYSTSNPIEDFYITKDFIAIQEYNKTTLQLKYINKSSKKVDEITFAENSFSFYFNKNKLDTSNTFQIDYESPKTPYVTYFITLENGNKTILEQEEFTINKNSYKIETVAVNNNQIKVPITLFYDEELIKDTIKGIILKSYGAYGAKYYPEFNAEDKVYVDLGFIIAFAHVRGGGELGDEWYNNGKQLSKINSFEDYIACAKFLTNKYEIDPKQLTGYGLSAGGLIMGYVANNYPELFGTLIFDRPYLDVLNTMMDSTLALTTMEYDEWGNPNEAAYYNYIKSYSPYQNITKQKYPNMLFFSGYHDEQTPYWQVAKSVAKYRENNTSNTLILLNTDMSGGHRGSTNSTQNTNKLAAKFSLINYTLGKDK